MSRDAPAAQPDPELAPGDAEASTLAHRAQQAVAAVTAWFPVRVWQRFSSRNGSVLAGGASYQALFAIFAALYVAFAILGLWLGGSRDAIDSLIRIINASLPGVISQRSGDGGIVTAAQVSEIADNAGTTLSITGIVAFGILLFTAIGWIGAIRSTVRSIFGLSPEQGNAVWLQVRDLIAAAAFAVLLLASAVLGFVGSSAIGWVFGLFGWPTDSFWFALLGQIVTFVATAAVNLLTLALMFRFLTGTALHARDILPGAALGAIGVTVLQVAFGYLVGKTPSNPLLVTFAVLIGLLLWIRMVMTVILLSAAWVAESAEQKHIALEPVDADELALQQARTLADAARFERDAAADALQSAGFATRGRARRALRRADDLLTRREDELTRLQHD